MNASSPDDPRPLVPLPEQEATAQPAKKGDLAKAVTRFAPFILAVFALGVVAFVFALNTGEISAVAAAFAAFIAAYFAGRLTDIGERQADISGEQLGALARQGDQIDREWVSTHRPKLRVRYFTYIGISGDDPAEVSFDIVNIGGSAATITDSSWKIVVRNPKLLSTPYYHAGKPVRPAGKVIDLTDSERVTVDDDFVSRTIEGKYQHLVIYGYIRYADQYGARRTTAFGRYWDAERARFLPVDDPEYNYED